MTNQQQATNKPTPATTLSPEDLAAMSIEELKTAADREFQEWLSEYLRQLAEDMNVWVQENRPGQ